MSVLPVSVTRTSDQLSQQRLLRQLNQDQVALQRLHDQLSTGQKLGVPSDDPDSAMRAIGLQRGLDYATQLTRNATAAEQTLTAADAALGEFGTAVAEARALTIQAAQEPLPESERLAIEASIDQLLQRVITAANREHQGAYLFAGGRGTSPPLVSQGNSVRFDGNHFEFASALESRALVPTGVTLGAVLGVGAPTVSGTVDLDPQLTRGTPLEAIANGQGWTPGRVRLSDGASGWTEIDLSQVETVGQLQDRLEAVELGGRALAVTVGPDSLQLGFADGLGGVLAVADLPGGTTAADLGWSNPRGMTPSPLRAEQLTPTLRTDTPLADLNAGAGVDVSAGLQIRQGDQWKAIDLSEAQSVGEVLTAINRAGMDVQATIDPEEHRIVIRSLRSGEDFGIGENGGSVATALGIRTATEETRLDELYRGRGVSTVSGAELTVVRPDGTELGIELDGLETVGEVLEAINAHAANTGTTERVRAELASVGNGIVLVGPAGPGTLVVRRAEGSNAAEALGLVERGASEAAAVADASGTRLAGIDFAPVEPGGAVDTLIRLRQAVERGETGDLERLQTRLDEDFEQVQTARVRTGLRLQSATSARQRVEEDAVRMRAELSEEVDVDFAEVVSQMTLRQAAMEASMRLIGQTVQMSILNFL